MIKPPKKCLFCVIPLNICLYFICLIFTHYSRIHALKRFLLQYLPCWSDTKKHCVLHIAIQQLRITYGVITYIALGVATTHPRQWTFFLHSTQASIARVGISSPTLSLLPLVVTATRQYTTRLPLFTHCKYIPAKSVCFLVR